jgi:RimJ/RimL family protein N-acetyltransferase
MIETARLSLRPLGIGDLEEVVAMHEDPDVARFNPLSRERAFERVRSNELQWAERGHGLFAVSDRTTGVFVGRVGLSYWPHFDETELGWTLRRQAWGLGYATEAAAACIGWGFSSLPLPYITAMIRPDNDRSQRVARRLGFSPLRDDELLGGPVTVYAITRARYRG